MYERHYNQTADHAELPEACVDEGPSSDFDPECASSVDKNWFASTEIREHL